MTFINNIYRSDWKQLKRVLKELFLVTSRHVVDSLCKLRDGHLVQMTCFDLSSSLLASISPFPGL